MSEKLKNKYEIEISVKIKDTNRRLKGVIETDLVEECDIRIYNFAGRMTKNLIEAFEKNG